MSRDKQTEMQFAIDLQNASQKASKIITDETANYVKQNHKYNNLIDYAKAHIKSRFEYEAEFLTELGYRKASDVASELIDAIKDCYVQMMEEADNTIEEAILNENHSMARIARYGKDVMLLTRDTLTKKLKKKYTEDGK